MLPPAKPKSWNHAAAAHLLGRAGFGATPMEVVSFFKLGRAQAIQAVLTVPPVAEPPQLDPDDKPPYSGIASMTPADKLIFIKKNQQRDRLELQTIRQWWIGQMLQPPSAFLEKATLFWHGHFATSVQKVKSAGMMLQQNQLLRKFAFGNFRDMVKAISCDPAMVIWLDLQQSRNGAPNENFARELMELFTLGIGHYSEDDIKASARAFTGYRTQRRQGGFDYYEDQHDATEKTFMGKTGRFSGDDIIDIIFQQPACATFICEKLWTFYASENPEPGIVAGLANTLRKSDYELRPVMKEMFGSEAFYNAQSMGTQIKSPTQLVTQTCLTLECPPPPGFSLKFIMTSLGQLLFAPPNVKGWDGNRAWINTATLASRQQFTDALVGLGDKQKGGFQSKVPLGKLVTNETLNDSAKLIDDLTHRLISTGIDQATRAELIAETDKYPKPLSQTAVRETLSRIMRLPEFQLV